MPYVCCPTLSTNTHGVFTVYGGFYKSALAMVTDKQQSRSSQPKAALLVALKREQIMQRKTLMIKLCTVTG